MEVVGCVAEDGRRRVGVVDQFEEVEVDDGGLDGDVVHGVQEAEVDVAVDHGAVELVF